MRPHPEPAREQNWRTGGRGITLAGCAATEFGDEEAPCVLLVHGWQGRGLQLGEFVAPLLAEGYRVIAMDLPGHGRTGGKISALPLMQAAIQRAFADDEVRAIAAHSLGASAAILAADATDWPGRILCLGGPGESRAAFERYAKMVGLPPRALAGFRKQLGKKFSIAIDDVDVKAAASRIANPVLAILAEGDDDVPTDESAEIVAAAGGSSCVLSGPTHRSVMWDAKSLELGVPFLLGR